MVAAIAAARANLPKSGRALEFGLGGKRVEREAAGQAFGYDEADKLARQRQYLKQKILALSEKQARTDEEEGELIKAQGMAYDNNLAILQRQAEVQREILQLTMDQNKEFAKSFFGAGPAEMLRKLAAFKLTMGGQRPLSQGQLFSLSPGMRQDAGLLTGKRRRCTGCYSSKGS